jgi:hypothetical protein
LINRRGFILVLSAPAIVTASNLMPIKQYRPDWILPYKGKQLTDAAFYYAPYVPVFIPIIKNVEQLPHWLEYSNG